MIVKWNVAAVFRQKPKEIYREIHWVFLYWAHSSYLE